MDSSSLQVRPLTLAYALAIILFPNGKEKATAMNGAASGIGVCIGPVIGSFIYSISGFMGPFIFSGLVNGV